MRATGLLLSLVAVAAVGSVLAQEPAAMMDKARSPASDLGSQAHDPAICAPDGIALGGYDVVTYRQAGGPFLGETSIHAMHNELRYVFVSEENRKRFEADPEKYVPAYSGFCAVTLALGQVTCPDYTNFRIEDGKLLLFETTGFTNGRTLWETDITGFREKADTNYGILMAPE